MARWGARKVQPGQEGQDEMEYGKVELVCALELGIPDTFDSPGANQ